MKRRVSGSRPSLTVNLSQKSVWVRGGVQPVGRYKRIRQLLVHTCETDAQQDAIGERFKLLNVRRASVTKDLLFRDSERVSKSKVKTGTLIIKKLKNVQMLLLNRKYETPNKFSFLEKV